EFSCGNSGSTKPLWCYLEKAHWVQYITTEDYHKKKKKIHNKSGTIEGFFKKYSKDSPALMLINVDNIKLYNIIATWIINQQRLLAII
ncbi:9449_t:CDS:2, partial [Dentiscutata erythropus]